MIFSKTALTLSVFAALGAMSALPAHAGNLPVFATGVDASGMSLPNGTQGDPHYTLVSTPSGTPGTVSVLTSAHGNPIVPNGWIGDSATSAWIVPNNEPFLDGGPTGYYDYQTTFDLSGFDPATASLSGQWATDNFGTEIRLNGQATGDAFNNSNNAYSPFSITGGFQPGLNTLDFIVLDDGQGATGLRVDGFSGNANPVPEASSTVSLGLLLTLGLGGAFLARRKALKG